MDLKKVTIYLIVFYSFVWGGFLHAEVYEVGENKPYHNISDVPLESIKAGDVVLIHYRKEPYKEKWVITASGTAENPVVFRGVKDRNGNLPVIDGKDAVTRKGMNFWSEARGIIKIGGSNNPPDTTPSYIVIENLEIINAHTPYTFTGRDGVTPYENNSAAIFVEKGENITIRGCVIHNNGNGIFVAHQAKNVLIESNYIYGNGNAGSAYEHNTYTEADGIIYQFNRFGPLMDGADGNNLKDRSAGTIIRYNYIESGNRQLDLVDSDYAELVSKEYYNRTLVYGNILIEPDGAGNSQILHYGGDSGNTDNYRKGTLYFYNNTVISTRSGNTTLMRLSSNDEKAFVFNNIVYATAGGSKLAILDSDGEATLSFNWINSGYKKSHSNPNANVLDTGNNITVEPVGFVDLENKDFHLSIDSVCIDRGMEFWIGYQEILLPEYEFSEDLTAKIRYKDERIDLGAFEFVKDISDAGNNFNDFISCVEEEHRDGAFRQDREDIPEDIYIPNDQTNYDILRDTESVDGVVDISEASGCSCSVLR